MSNRIEICANMINAKYKDYTLLDAGCRTKELKGHLMNCREYYGADLSKSDGVLACDLNKKLPFKDGDFDIVTILDVLEHLDNPHETLQELIRITNKALYISLPNMYYIEFRLRFLRGNGISDKYTFPDYPIEDRHRWVLSYSESLSFVYNNTKEYKVRHKMILPVRERTKIVSVPLEKWLAHRWPNMFAYGSLFEVSINK